MALGVRVSNIDFHTEPLNNRLNPYFNNQEHSLHQKSKILQINSIYRFEFLNIEECKILFMERYIVCFINNQRNNFIYTMRGKNLNYIYFRKEDPSRIFC